MDVHARGRHRTELTDVPAPGLGLSSVRVRSHAVAEERSTVETTTMTRTVGRVTALDAATLTVLTPAGKVQQLRVDDSTAVFRTAPGDGEDINDDSRIVVKRYADSPKSAQEVIVLPGDSPYGVPVVEREPDWVTTRNSGGKLAETYLGYATISRTRVGSFSDHVPKGSMIFGFVERTDNTNEREFTAKLLIVLPQDTAFGS
jgi:hypothetical protein